MKKIIIFGATGNVGAYLVDYCYENLPNDFELIAVGRKQTDFFEKKYGIRYIRLDIVSGDFGLLPEEDVYAIINLAGLLPAYSKEINPVDYINANIIGAINVLEYARKVKCDRVLYTQSWSDLAGYWGKESVLTPDMPPKIVYTGDHAFYSITKSTVVETMKLYKAQFGIKNFVFRLPNVYLYHPRLSYYVDGVEQKIGYRYMIEKAIAGEEMEIWGDPNAFKDILYVKDLCQMMFKALFAPSDGGLYNAGTGVKTTLREQIKGIIDVFSPSKNVHIIELPDRPSFVSFVMNIDNAKKELGYEPLYLYRDYLLDYKKERDLKRFDELWN